MKWAAWIVGAALFFTWAQTILAFAVFAVPDRYDGAEAVVFSLITVVIGFAVPIGVVWALRTQGLLVPPHRAAPPGVMSRNLEAAPAVVEDDGWGDEPPTEPLTEREIEVLELVAAGKSNKEIAQELVISVGTVKTHTNNLYRKLSARNRTEAVATAQRRRLI